jgi:tRNA(Ile)-lysidine synthase
LPRCSPPPSARRGAIDKALDPLTLRRFTADLDALVAPGAPIGVAVSGGPDSLALLLLASEARPSLVEAASVDHRLRAESAAEVAAVARLCAELGVPHTVLEVEVAPGASLQAQARTARYAALQSWAEARGLSALATAHHRDDQAETVAMRLARGAGVAGLAAIRPSRPLGPDVTLVRPLLGWSKAELADIVDSAGIAAADDPSNRDPRHDRSRIRAALAKAEWLDRAALAATAHHLREADEALDWATARLCGERISTEGEAVVLDPEGLPAELLRRLLVKGFARFGAPRPRGPDLARATEALRCGRPATLSGLRLAPGRHWRIERESPRRGPTAAG